MGCSLYFGSFTLDGCVYLLCTIDCPFADMPLCGTDCKRVLVSIRVQVRL